MGWLLPTHNRPEQCSAVLAQIKRLGNCTIGCVMVNGREQADDYKRLEAWLPDGWYMEFLPQNLGMCGAMQHYFHGHPNDPFYGLVCDDEYVFTPGWDKTLVEAAGKFGIAHGNGWQSQNRLHNYVTWGGDLIRTVGWWALPGLWHWFFDDAWEAIAGALGLRRFCPTVNTEHRHYLAGKAERDATYALGESRATQDQQRFLDWHRHEWPALLERLEVGLTGRAEIRYDPTTL